MLLQEITGSLEIQKVDYDDPKIRRLIQQLNRRIFTDELIDTSKDNQAVWWIVSVDGEIAGYCSIMPRAQGGYLSRAGVLRQFQGQGLQKQMIKTRLDYARQQGWPWVVTDTHRENWASMHNLQKMGFRPYKPRRPQMPSSWIKQSRFWILRLD